MIDKPNPFLILFLGIFTGLFVAAYESATSLPLKSGLMIIMGVFFFVTALLSYHYATYLAIEEFREYKHAATETKRSHQMDSAHLLSNEQAALIPHPTYGLNVGMKRGADGSWESFIVIENDDGVILIPFDFAEKFIKNSNDEYCWSERATSDKTEEREFYLAFSDFLWVNEFAELRANGRKTRWIENGRALIAKELGIELVPELRSVVVTGDD